MADENAGTIQNFVTILLDYANGSLKRAVDGLTDEQVFHQPTGDTNNIAWLAWHMNRWKDWQGNLVTGEEQVWIRDGWCERFGIPAERTGIGDSTEQVAEFRPPLELLWGYTEAAHTTFIERVNSLSQEQLEEMVHYIPGPRRSSAEVAVDPWGVLGHYEAHGADRVPAGVDHGEGVVRGVGGAVFAPFESLRAGFDFPQDERRGGRPL